MQFSSSLIVCVMGVALIHITNGVTPAQRVDRSSAVLQPSLVAPKSGEEPTGKLLRLDDLVRTENDVMEPKMKRGYPGNNNNNAPLDRLSVGSMETKQANKPSKVVELPRRRANAPPIDRIGMSGLPNRG